MCMDIRWGPGVTENQTPPLQNTPGVQWFMCYKEKNTFPFSTTKKNKQTKKHSPMSVIHNDDDW